jgi:TIR domain
MTPIHVEEFWEDLLALTERGRVIPVLGAELLSVRDGSRVVPLYDVVAERLLERYKVSSPTAGLYQAVSALVASGTRPRDLYRVVHDILQKVVAEHPEAMEPLRELASIRHFDSFVTTTPDNLLARALDEARYGGERETTEIEYAPKLPTELIVDIPERPRPGHTAVFYMFGKADVSPFFAIHEEDALEFLYRLQGGGGPERMLAQIRSRSLMLIGCSFANWLSRFFLRLSNTDRLSSDQRTKKEYLVGRDSATDRDFVVFLERFSQDSRLYPFDVNVPDPRGFVHELSRRWRERNPAAAPPSGAAAPAAEGAIFISYAREDISAAKALYAQLQEISGDVAWFDKSELAPGETWEREIRSAIQRCTLFLPLISSTTEARSEGFFREEWTQAAERARRIEGRQFIVPVVIDQEYDGNAARYSRVSDFSRFHFGHAPQGHMSETLAQTLQREIRIRRGGKPA